MTGKAWQSNKTTASWFYANCKVSKYCPQALCFGKLCNLRPDTSLDSEEIPVNDWLQFSHIWENNGYRKGRDSFIQTQWCNWINSSPGELHSSSHGFLMLYSFLKILARKPLIVYYKRSIIIITFFKILLLFSALPFIFSLMEAAINILVSQFKAFAGKEGPSHTLSRDEFQSLLSSQLPNYMKVSIYLDFTNPHETGMTVALHGWYWTRHLHL